MKSITLSIIFLLLSALPLIAEDLEKGEGKELFELRCGGMCHQLPDPEMLKVKQWRMILGVMQQRMKQKGIEPLTDEELETIFGYLKENARK